MNWISGCNITKKAFGKHVFPFREVWPHTRYPSNLCEWEDWRTKPRNFSPVYKCLTHPLHTFVWHTSHRNNFTKRSVVTACCLFSATLQLCHVLAFPLSFILLWKWKTNKIMRDLIFLHQDPTLPADLNFTLFWSTLYLLFSLLLWQFLFLSPLLSFTSLFATLTILLHLSCMTLVFS